MSEYPTGPNGAPSNQRPHQIYGPSTRRLIMSFAMLVVFGPMMAGFLLAEVVGGPNAGFIRLFGALIGIGIGFVLQNHLTFAIIKWLRPRLAAKLSKVYGMDLHQASTVGYSPGAELRSYSGDTCWDHGFLVLEAGRLRYLGELTSFELTSDQIRAIDPVGNAKSSSLKLPKFLFRWADPATGQEGSFVLEWGEATNAAQCRRLYVEVLQWLRDWWQVGASGGAYGVYSAEEASASVAAAAPAKLKGSTGVAARIIGFIAAMVIYVPCMIVLTLIFGTSVLGNPYYRFGSVVLAVLASNGLAVLVQRIIDAGKKDG